jgi:RNA polymerase sigma factor (sigma-70 family)
MDNLLLPLLKAGDEQERQRCLEELLTIHVAPIVRQVLRQRLGLYVSAQGVNENDHDAEDLYQEAMTRMVEVLHADQQSLTRIENFEPYVGRIVSNICRDFLRSKYPTRARLKDALRDVFRRHNHLDSWQYEDEILCGFTTWRNNSKPPVIIDEVDTTLNAFRAARFADEDVRVVALSRVVAELFEWIGGPVQIHALVRMLAFVRDVRDQQIESLDDQVDFEFAVNSQQSMQSTGSEVEAHQLLRRLWHILKRLQPGQRDAFALRFHDHEGRNLFTVLLAAGIVDWKDLAEGMERSVADVSRLWTQMPMDTGTAAIELHTSRENVYKLRYRAIQKLKRELE